MTQAFVSSGLFPQRRDSVERERSHADDIVALLGEDVDARYREVRKLSRGDHDAIVSLLVGTTRLCQGPHLWDRDKCERHLIHCTESLASQIGNQPLHDGEELRDYVEHMRQRDSRIADMLTRIANVHLLLAHYDAEAAAERKARRDAQEAERKAQHDALLRESEPDRERIKLLLSRIEGASDGERLLGNIAAAIERHRVAEKARSELTQIFEHERSACMALGKRTPSRPDVPQAPLGVVELLTRLSRG